MSDDFLNYNKLIDDAKRDVIRKAMSHVAAEGLPEEHYFHIWFQTDHPGVEIADSLRHQYPKEMPIVLQNAFWDLEVGEEVFSVTLSFNRVSQRLTVPFEAIAIFQDPPANFGLQFQADEADVEEEDAAAEEPAEAVAAEETAEAPEEAAGAEDKEDGDGKAKKGDNVVALHAFRNK